MRIAAAALVAALLAGLSVEADIVVYTRPEVPRQETLQRLGLKRRWHVYLPMNGLRDGIGSISVSDGQLIAQTMGGSVIVLDGETGATAWRANLGLTYRGVSQYLATNPRMVFIVSGSKLYGMERATGVREWTYDLSGALTAAPAADLEWAYLCTGDGRLHAYLLPGPLREQPPPEPAAKPGKPVSPRSSYAAGSPTLSPYLRPALRTPQARWQFQTDGVIHQTPALTATHVVIADSRGELYSLQREQRALADRFPSRAPITAPFGQVGESLYVASQDYNVYAFDVILGKLVLRWRFVTGGQVVKKPMPIGDELYVVGEGRGLICLDRHTGALLWRTPGLDRFLAASRRMVFAADSRGRVVVLDRQRGRPMGTLDTRDFAVLVPNDVTDRLYLANHDGLVVCLSDLDPTHDQPVYHNRPREPEKPKPDTGAKPAEPDKPGDNK